RRSLGVILDLYFVASAQVHAAVRMRCAIELDVELEILESSLRTKIGAISGAHQCAVADCPGRLAVRVARSPPSQILAIEQRSWRPPLQRPHIFERRRPPPPPCPHRPIGAARFSHQRLSLEPPFENHVVGPALLLLG